ncbi:MAG TPA: bifunctional DNA primase/polymerase [Pseudonocardiaceae bacterium]|nr:bifunctional DNA primase/polymerase [Pseudonocardiaceae bacterium]
METAKVTEAPKGQRNAALAAAERGWRVFPLRPGIKRPALHRFDRCPRTGPCEHAHQGWEQRATTDPDRIRAAWTAAAFNIGLAAGPSGLVVIDLDAATPGETAPPPWDQPGVSCGEDVLAVLAEQAGAPLPVDTLTVSTPSGGLHLYYRTPEGTALRNTQGDRGAGLGWKIDTRAHGGYVLAPGSTVEGRPYTVVQDTAPAPLPGWLLERLQPAPLPPPPGKPRQVATSRRGRYLQAAIDVETAKVTEAPKGQRNAALYAAAVALGQLVAGGALTEAEVNEALMRAAGKHLACGAYSPRQASATIASGLRAGANRPREVAA